MSKILVAEDILDNYCLIEDVLEEDHELVHVANGRDVMTKTNECLPDLILLDMGLPGADGWRIAKSLKANKTFAHIPIIAITAHAMSGDREKCLEAGCDEYLSKPISILDLVNVVDRWAKKAECPLERTTMWND